MRLRMLVGGIRLRQIAAFVIDIEMSLRGTVDAIGPVQAGIEPLRRVRRAHLRSQHVAKLVEEGLGVVFGIEIAALPAPIGPGAGKAIEYLLRRLLADIAFRFRQRSECGFVGDVAPQEGGDRILLHLFQARRHAGLAEIFLREHVRGHLRPEVGDLDIVEPEHHRAVGIFDFACGQPELHLRVGRLAVLGIAPLNSHSLLAPLSSSATLRRIVPQHRPVHPCLRLLPRSTPRHSNSEPVAGHRFPTVCCRHLLATRNPPPPRAYSGRVGPHKLSEEPAETSDTPAPD